MSSDGRDLESQVASTLLTANRMGHAVIEVEYSDGRITLKGTVESEQDRTTAQTLAQEQEGVVEVINKLKISDL